MLNELPSESKGKNPEECVRERERESSQRSQLQPGVSGG